MRGPILFLCPGLFNIRNVLHSRMIPTLRALGHPVAVLGTGLDPETAARTSGYAELRPLRRVRSGRLLSAIDVVQRASFFRRYGLTNDRVTLWWYRREDSPVARLGMSAIESLSIVGARSPFYEWQLTWMDRLKRSTWDLGPARSALESMQPAVVVATSCIRQIEEPYVMAARELGIPTLGYVQSFDHLTGRSFTIACDHHAVWNERMRSHLQQYHGVTDAARIHLTGTAQFDFHRQDEFRWDRETTLARLGLQPGARYVLYAGNTYQVTPSEPELVQQFAARVAATPALAGHTIVVRVHPNDEFGRWDGMSAAGVRVVVSRPSSNRKSYSTPEEQARLVSTVLHADVCLNVWSSMSLDAAAVDTPVVAVGFAAHPGSAEDRFCRTCYDTDYYRPIVESGGVRFAKDMDELLSETVEYVMDRSRDREERAALAREECGPLDGHSAERIARLIAGIAAERPVAAVA